RRNGLVRRDQPCRRCWGAPGPVSGCERADPPQSRLVCLKVVGRTLGEASGSGQGQSRAGAQAGRRVAQNVDDGRGLPTEGCVVAVRIPDRLRVGRSWRGPFGDGVGVSAFHFFGGPRQLVRGLHAANKEAPSSSCPYPI